MQINRYKDKIIYFLGRLGDIRFVGQMVFLVIVLLISWSGVKTIQTNYGLQKQITTIKQQNNLQKLENDNLALQNEYLNSNQFLELSARENFGLAAPGEKLVIVPAKVAQAYTIDFSDNLTDNEAEAKKPVYQGNFESWVDFFLHRQNSTLGQ